MEATIVPDVQKHYPVLLKEIISVITPQHGGTFIDCTFGQGGYSKKILEFENTKVIGLDRDIESQKIANSILDDFEDRFIFKNLKFSQLTNLKIKNENIKGVIFDLGYSLTQMKDPKKGLSFNSMTDLNMQLGLNNYSADDAINKLDAKELEKIFKYFGDEKDAKYISKNIVKERLNKKIDTQGLIKIVDKSKIRKNFKVHNSTKVFQALRIFVNKEISELIYGLIAASKVTSITRCANAKMALRKLESRGKRAILDVGGAECVQGLSFKPIRNAKRSGIHKCASPERKRIKKGTYPVNHVNEVDHCFHRCP